MQPTSYSQFTVENISLKSLIEPYCEWILGVGKFADKRRARIESGVPERVSVDDLFRGDDFRTQERCTIRTRHVQSPDRWLLHFIHLDSHDDDVTWHNLSCLEETANGVSVEHLVGRALPLHIRPDPTWAPPVITRHIVENYGHKLDEKELFNSEGILLNEEEVAAFVSHSLLQEKRKVPLVFLSPRQDTGRFIEASALADKLVGMAGVVEMASPEACWKFEEVLRIEGLGQRFGCNDGAIRLYWPGLTAESDPYDHPLWPSSRLLSGLGNRPTERLAAWIGQALAERVSTHSWLSIIADIDLMTLQQRTQVLLRTEPPPPPSATSDVAELKEAVEQRDERISNLEAQLKLLLSQQADAKAMQDFLASEHQKVEREMRLTGQKLEQMEEELEVKTVQAAALLAQRLFPDRLLVLEQAVKSAGGCPYRNPRLLFKVLSLLAVTAAKVRLIPSTEEKPKRVPPPPSSASEDDLSLLALEKMLEALHSSVKWSPKDTLETRRTFPRRFFSTLTDEVVEFELHVTLGGGKDPQACMQVYYRYVVNPESGNKMVEVGHIGEHLKTFGQDTSTRRRG
jgi:hypothetical protein